MRISSQLLLTFLLNSLWQIALITAVAAVGSWLLRNHVSEGREHLNLSELTEFSDSDRDEISNEVEFGTMPLKSYLLMHPAARVTPEERKLLNDWANGTLKKSN